MATEIYKDSQRFPDRIESSRGNKTRRDLSRDDRPMTG